MDNDLFISYAHNDNEPLINDPDAKGWIDDLHHSIGVRLKQLLGREARIWFDPQLRRTMQWSQKIIVEVLRSDLLLTVLSPSYLNSDWCARELAEFCGREGGIHVGDRVRVIKVVKTRLERAEHPEPIRDILPFEFYYLDPAKKQHRELGQRGAETDRRYWEIFEDLCHDIAELLKIIASTDLPPTPSPEHTVYLAEVTPDVLPVRHQLRRELKSLNYYVVPDRILPPRVPEFPASVRNYLNRSRLSIHIIGREFGPRVVGTENASVVSLQNELAAERCAQPGFSRLIYIPQGTSPADSQQREFIQRLREGDEALAGTDIIETFEELRMVARQKLRSASPAAPRRSNRGRRSVYLVFAVEDLARVRTIKEYLHGHGYEIELPLLEGENERAIQRHKAKLSDCDAVLYYYGSGSQEWMEQHLLYLESIVGTKRGEGQPFGRAEPMSARLIYVASPKTIHKDELLTYKASVIRNYDDFSPDDLGGFLWELKGGEPGAGGRSATDAERAG